MSIRAAFLWQREPAYFFLRYGAATPMSVDSAAILFPIISKSWMSKNLAETLLSLGLCIRRGNEVVADIRVQGVEQKALEFIVLSRMPRFPSDGRRASVLLGLNFIAAFGTAQVNLDDAVGSITIG